MVTSCPACGRPLSPVTNLYEELTNNTMTWVDVVFWLVIGALGGGAIAWSVGG